MLQIIYGSECDTNNNRISHTTKFISTQSIGLLFHAHFGKWVGLVGNFAARSDIF